MTSRALSSWLLLVTDTIDPPKDFDELRAAILERKASLPKRLTQVAAFALDNPDEIALSMLSLAASRIKLTSSFIGR